MERVSIVGEIALIPVMDSQTAVLLGIARPEYGYGAYAVRIGLCDVPHPYEARSMTFEDSYQFQNWRMMLFPEQSVFDLVTPTINPGPMPVSLSTAALFANGSIEPLFTSLRLFPVLRQILGENDGGVSVLQFMIQKYGQEIGLKTLSMSERYASDVYGVIGAPIAKKNGQ